MYQLKLISRTATVNIIPIVLSSHFRGGGYIFYLLLQTHLIHFLIYIFQSHSSTRTNIHSDTPTEQFADYLWPTETSASLNVSSSNRRATLAGARALMLEEGWIYNH